MVCITPLSTLTFLSLSLLSLLSLSLFSHICYLFSFYSLYTFYSTLRSTLCSLLFSLPLFSSFLSSPHRIYSLLYSTLSTLDPLLNKLQCRPEAAGNDDEKHGGIPHIDGVYRSPIFSLFFLSIIYMISRIRIFAILYFRGQGRAGRL